MVVAGLRTHYRDRGQGLPIVLLHGSYSSLHTWEGWSEALSPHHRVVTLDLPGHGLTGPDPEERYRPAAMADFVETFTARMGLRRFVVGGNSMGGRVAAELALRDPNRVERLILVDAAGLAHHTRMPVGLRVFQSAAMDCIARWVTPRIVIRRALREAYGDPSRVTESLVDRYEDLMLREGNRRAIRGSLRQLAQDEFEIRLRRIHAPTLILWGALDRSLPERHAERFHSRIRGSRVVVFAGLGHMPMEEDPVRTASEVLGFLNAGGPNGA